MHPSTKRGLCFGPLAGALAVASLAISLPATAANNAATGNTSNKATSPQSDTRASAQPAPQNQAGGAQQPGRPAKPKRPPSQRLPEPQPTDYGYSNFNAPSDAELDLFAATHQPPSDNANQNPVRNDIAPQNASDRAGSSDNGASVNTAPANAKPNNNGASSGSNN